jgi:hypothetical protein
VARHIRYGARCGKQVVTATARHAGAARSATSPAEDGASPGVGGSEVARWRRALCAGHTRVRLRCARTTPALQQQKRYAKMRRQPRDECRHPPSITDGAAGADEAMLRRRRCLGDKHMLRDTTPRYAIE